MPNMPPSLRQPMRDALGKPVRFYVPDDFRRLVTDSWHEWRWTLSERDRATDRAYAGFPEDLFYLMEREGLAPLEGLIRSEWMTKPSQRLIPKKRRSFAAWNDWFFTHTPVKFLEEHGWVWREPKPKMDFSTITTREL